MTCLIYPSPTCPTPKHHPLHAPPPLTLTLHVQPPNTPPLNALPHMPYSHIPLLHMSFPHMPHPAHAPPPGELTNALSHLETFYQLARRHKWHTDSGDGLHEIACEHLRRVYTTLAERDREGGRVEYLCKALDMAKESEYECVRVYIRLYIRTYVRTYMQSLRISHQIVCCRMPAHGLLTSSSVHCSHIYVHTYIWPSPPPPP